MVSLAVIVIVVQAPTCTRSPSWSGTGTKGWMGSSPPLTVVPFVEFWSTTAQLPSGCWTSTACWCETPGSSGGTDRSMSGDSPVECRRRPIVIWLPVSGRCCSGEYAGRFRPAASGPERCIIAMKYSRSGPIVAVQDSGCCW